MGFWPSHERRPNLEQHHQHEAPFNPTHSEQFVWFIIITTEVQLTTIWTILWGRDSSVGRVSEWKARHNTDAGLSPPCGMGFFPKVNFQCRLLQCLYSPPCSVACINICVHIKNPQQQRWQTYHLFGHTKILHTLIGMGSSALAAAVSYPGKATWISCMGQRNTTRKQQQQQQQKKLHSKTSTETWLLLSFTLQTSFLHTSSGDRRELQDKQGSMNTILVLVSKQPSLYLRLVSLCWRNCPSWLQARTRRLGSESMWMMRLMASKSTAFLALECCTFLDLGGSWALFRIVSRHSVSRVRTLGSSAK